VLTSYDSPIGSARNGSDFMLDCELERISRRIDESLQFIIFIGHAIPAARINSI
jgi:hypothetical protein